MNRINEKELKEIFIVLKSKRSEEAFNELYKKNNQLVYKIAFTILRNKEDSEDITQTVFTKIHDIELEKLPERHIASWLYTVTKNEAISLLRRNKETINIEDIYEIENANNEIDETIDIIRFNEMIRGLSIKEKEIVTLKIIAEMSFNEISKLLGESEGTIKWRYYKAINTLKILLSNLAMFIITFVIGLRELFKKTKLEITTDKSQEIDSNETEEQEITSSKNNFEEIISSSELENENTTIYPTNINYTYNKEIAIFSISGIFLIITIIFAIVTLKHKKRK